MTSDAAYMPRLTDSRPSEVSSASQASSALAISIQVACTGTSCKHTVGMAEDRQSNFSTIP